MNERGFESQRTDFQCPSSLGIRIRSDQTLCKSKCWRLSGDYNRHLLFLHNKPVGNGKEGFGVYHTLKPPFSEHTVVGRAEYIPLLEQVDGDFRNQTSMYFIYYFCGLKSCWTFFLVGPATDQTRKREETLGDMIRYGVWGVLGCRFFFFFLYFFFSSLLNTLFIVGLEQGTYERCKFPVDHKKNKNERSWFWLFNGSPRNVKISSHDFQYMKIFPTWQFRTTDDYFLSLSFF